MKITLEWIAGLIVGVFGTPLTQRLPRFLSFWRHHD